VGLAQTPRDDPDLATTFNRIQSVGQEVEEDLLEHLEVAADRTPIGKRGHDDPLIRQGGLPLHEGYGFCDNSLEVDQAKGRLALTGEIK
jgi:hypothetical protein